MPRPYSEDETARRLRPHDRVLAALARQVPLPGPLARGRAPLGADAEAAHLPADRRDRRGAHDQPARAPRRRAQLGLPLHLDPRRRLLAVRPAAARLHRGGGGVHGLAARALPRAAHRGDRAAPDHVRDRRPLGARGGGPRPPRGLPRLVAGADRQRRRRAAPARHLRRDDRLGLLLQPPRLADRPRLVDRPVPGDRLGLRELGPGRRGHLGGARRAASTTPTRG